MPEQPPEQPPKLIIDEDWKAQVQREKAQAAEVTESLVTESLEIESLENKSLENKSLENKSGGRPIGKDEVAATGQQAADERDAPMQLPPPTFDFLISMLATQALHAMGQLPGPEGDLAKPEKPIAKHYIDLLGVIETKTTGNLEPNESKMLTEVLHQLRLAYLKV